MRVAAPLACALLAAGCASWPRAWGDRPCCIEGKPSVSRPPIWWHLVDATLFEPVEGSLHLIRTGRKLAGVPIRASNLDDGRVADTTFFADRDPAQLSPEQIRWGPTQPDDRAAPPFTVTRSKTEGKTPGFFVTDARGVRYLFKLDPVDAPELLSGAEVVTSKLLYALGYHVPSYEVVFVRPEELRDANGSIGTSLEPRLRNGRVRVAASRILEGDIVGPAPLKKFRDCAEIRALRLAYAWVNNTDTKDHNSLLVWTGTETVGYLIDFGTSLGADAGLAGPKAPCEGWVNRVDLTETAWKLSTLGLHRSGCDPRQSPFSTAVGRFSAHFDPKRWKPYVPNVAFAQMNQEDARWMARRMARFSRAQIEAAVSAGHYSDPHDATYLVDVLDQRRRITVRRYLGESPEEVAQR